MFDLSYKESRLQEYMEQFGEKLFENRKNFKLPFNKPKMQKGTPELAFSGRLKYFIRDKWGLDWPEDMSQLGDKLTINDASKLKEMPDLVKFLKDRKAIIKVINKPNSKSDNPGDEKVRFEESESLNNYFDAKKSLLENSQMYERFFHKYVDALGKEVEKSRKDLTVDRMSGAWEFDIPKYPSWVLYATPFWEGSKLIQFEIGSDQGDGTTENLKDVPFEMTGYLKDDAKAYLKIADKMLKVAQGQIKNYDK